MNNKKLAFAIDIGGTKIYSSLIDENGAIIFEPKKNQTPKTACDIKNLLAELIKEYEDKADIVAIATAGAVNNDNSAILSSTGNLPSGYKDINFQSLSKKLKVFVENDANCAAWAEHSVGAAKGSGHSITLTLGTGVGGGIIINNALLKGKSGAAGEMHFKMSTKRLRQCTCGAYDCFEIYTSGTGLKITASDILKQDVTTYEVIERAEKGDKDCIFALEKWHNDIIDGLIGLNDIFDTEVIVLSGSMGQFVDVKKVQDEVNKQIVTTPVKVKHACAGNFSGMIGAAILALNKI